MPGASAVEGRGDQGMGRRGGGIKGWGGREGGWGASVYWGQSFSLGR